MLLTSQWGFASGVDRRPRVCTPPSIPGRAGLSSQKLRGLVATEGHICFLEGHSPPCPPPISLSSAHCPSTLQTHLVLFLRVVVRVPTCQAPFDVSAWHLQMLGPKEPQKCLVQLLSETGGCEGPERGSDLHRGRPDTPAPDSLSSTPVLCHTEQSDSGASGTQGNIYLTFRPAAK